MTQEAVASVINSARKPQETQEQVILRLALLSPFDYDRVREQEADALNVRVGTLDKQVSQARRPEKGDGDIVEMFPTVSPWPAPVNGAALLTEMAQTVKRFIVCDAHTATAAALWIAFTWFVDHVQVAPLAVITAPEKRCGKSQLLDLIGRLSRRPLVGSNISPSCIFRVIESWSPTLLIDEADTFLRDNEEARGILNSGHTRPSAFIIRNVRNANDDHEPRQFSTWGAKAISGIGSLPDTLMDRAITLELRRKLPHENVERLRHADLALFQSLASMLSRYAEDNAHAVSKARPTLPDTLNDRAQDNWEPLLAIADCAGGDWPELGRKAALSISGSHQDSISLSAELLTDIREVLSTRYSEKITTQELLECLNADDLKPWCNYNRGKPMSPRQLAKRLSEYGIKPQNLSIGAARPKGYHKDQFEDAFFRYLTPSSSYTPELSATPLPIGSNTKPQPLSKVADNPLRSGSENLSAPGKAAENKESSGVADKIGVHSIVEVEI